MDRTGGHDRPPDGRVRRRWLRWAGHGGAPAGGRRRRPDHREGRRLRRHVVLEPVPRRAVRHGVHGVPAAAGRDRALPTEKYVHGPEILAHCRRIGERFGLYEDVLFHTEVTGLSWDELVGFRRKLMV